MRKMEEGSQGGREKERKRRSPTREMWDQNDHLCSGGRHFAKNAEVFTVSNACPTQQ